MNVMHRQIKGSFTNPIKTMAHGLWFSGYVREGEYKEWHNNGPLYKHCFYKNNELDGEYKSWWENGQLQNHAFYKQGAPEGEIKMWLSDGTLTMHKLLKMVKQ